MDRDGQEKTGVESAVEEFRAIVDGLDSVVYVADMTTREVLFINAFGRQRFGDIAGQICWKTLQANQSGPCSFCTNDQLVGADGGPGGPYVWEFQNTADGRWYECRDQAIPWVDGRLVRLEIATDITARRRADEVLRQSSERYGTLFNAISEGFALHEIICDEGGRPVDYRFLEVNPTFEKILGLKADDVVGKTVLEVLPKTEQHRIDMYGQVALTGQPAHFTHYWQEFDRHFEVSAFRPGPGQFACVFTDVTAKMQLNEALLFTKFAVDRMADGAFWMGADAKFIYVNDAACRLLGYSREELLTMTVHDIDPSLPVEAWPAHWRHVKEQRSFTVESHHRRKDGHVFPVEIGVNFVEFGGKEYNCAFARDITEREQVRQALREAEAKIQHARHLESLGVLGGGIAHDFNNLLTVILGNAQVALLDLAPDSPLRENVDEIRKASLGAAQLTRQMLAYSGRGATAMGPVDLGEIVVEMGNLLPGSLPNSVPVVYDLAEDLPVAHADVAQITQAVVNLATNAAEALADQDGAITVRTGMMTADRACLDQYELGENMDEGPCVYVEVCDSGCGMEAETLARLFEPFYTTKFMGRGLGLPAVLGIMRGHSGAIRVDSRPGRGTTVRLLLPPASQAPPPAPEPTRAKPARAPATGRAVLVIDDEEPVRAVTRRVLEHEGHSVLTAGSGREGVELFRQRADDIAVILLDLTMPRMDGLATFAELRRISSDVPIILCSGYSEVDATSRFAGMGLAGFLQKPYEIDDLTAKLTEVMQR